MPQAESPLISIITPALNRAEMISHAIESVGAQSQSSIEHIIVDGQSSDGTLEVLSKFPHLEVISEPDHGVYDAWNKGIDRARGRYIGFLNSDDWFEPGSLQVVMQTFQDNPSLEVVSGAARHMTSTAAGERKTVFTDDKPGQIEISVWSAGHAPNMNARFFRRDLFTKFGQFDFKNFPLSADRDFLFRVVIGGAVHASVNRLVYSYLNHESSQTLHGNWRKGREGHLENVAIAEKHLAATTLSPDDRLTLERWHDECAIKAAASAFLNGEVSTSFGMLRGPLRRPYWPVTLSNVAAKALRRKVRRLL